MGTSAALWIPVIWFAVIGSRPVSVWFGSNSASSHGEGNAFDRALFQLLMLAAAVIIAKRPIRWHQFCRSNLALVCLFAYFLCSCLWSIEPLTAFKRWSKDVGNILMVLVVLTDDNHDEAVRKVFSRLGYLLIPTSVLVTKYFPEIGRYYSVWDGQVFHCGITLDKNMLGMTLFTCMFGALWTLASRKRRFMQWVSDVNSWVSALLSGIAFWLLLKSGSATAAGVVAFGFGAYFACQLPLFRAFASGFGYLLSLVAFGLPAAMVFAGFALPGGILGRDGTLTGRLQIWTSVLNQDIDPLLGTGYYSFWLGERNERLSADYFYELGTAHNSYVETYLNGGLVAVSILLCLILAAFHRTGAELRSGESVAALRFAGLVATVTYGITEVFINRLSPVWLVMLIVLLGSTASRWRSQINRRSENQDGAVAGGIV